MTFVELVQTVYVGVTEEIADKWSVVYRQLSTMAGKFVIQYIALRENRIRFLSLRFNHAPVKARQAVNATLSNQIAMCQSERQKLYTHRSVQGDLTTNQRGLLTGTVRAICFRSIPFCSLEGQWLRFCHAKGCQTKRCHRYRYPFW